MTDEPDRLDRGVMSVLDRRLQQAGDPLPWESVAGRTAASYPGRPTKTRWIAFAASLALVFGAIAALTSIVGQDDPVVTELPPPTLEPVDVDGVGPTRPLSSIVRGDVVVPTRLFEDLELEPVIVDDSWRSTWAAYDGARDDSDVVIVVSTAMDGEQVGSPDAELTADGVDWTVLSFGRADHHAFARFDRLAVFVEVRGIGLGDLEVLLGGLRAGEPDSHASSTYDADSGGVEVTRSADGEYALEAARVGEWLCTTIRPVRQSETFAMCALTTPQDDGSMLIGTVVTGTPVDGESTEDGPQRTTVFAAGFVPLDAIGADIVHVEGPTEFARAEDRSGSFDMRFVLGVKSFDDAARADPSETFGRSRVEIRSVFEN